MSVVTKILVPAALMISTLVASGCYKHTFTVGSGGNIEKDPNFDEWQNHWFYGIFGDRNIDVKTVCPSGNATIKEETTFVNGLIGGLVGVIYYPTTVAIWCGEGGEAPNVSSITLAPAEMQRLALTPEAMRLARAISPEKAAELAAAVEIFEKAHRNVAGSGAPNQL